MEMSSDLFRRIGEYCLAFEAGEVDVVMARLEEAYRRRKTIYVFGNGGSGATASHFCQDLEKGTLLAPTDARRFKVLSLQTMCLTSRLGK
jgi:D-sedoheptulose 7-phosphate isomerase